MANQYGARMGARWWAAPAMALAMALAVGMTGCATSSKPPEQAGLMVDALPAPNFGGPELTEAVAPPMIAAKPQPVLPPPPRYSGTAGIPREWTPFAQPIAWRWIVIHHSATTTGGAAAFDKDHKAKGWDELGYHFVVGNGTDTRDGQVEVGSRWPRQKWGAHAKTPDNRFNEFGIGICLVGNFDISRPSDEQMKSLSKLVAFLMRTYRIPPERVVGHGDTGKATDCPGKLMNVAQVRQMSIRALADAGEQVPGVEQATATAAIQLMHDANH